MSRLPVELSYAAHQKMPNQYNMCLTAAHRAKELSKGKTRQIDAALKDIADGKIDEKYMVKAIQKEIEQKRKEKLKMKGRK